MASTFYSFVVTACGVRAHRNRSFRGGGASHRARGAGTEEAKRVQALVTAARESIVIVYGFAVMLLIAAAIEAFWSSARWLPHIVKYSVAAVLDRRHLLLPVPGPPCKLMPSL